MQPRRMLHYGVLCVVVIFVAVLIFFAYQWYARLDAVERLLRECGVGAPLGVYEVSSAGQPTQGIGIVRTLPFRAATGFGSTLLPFDRVTRVDLSGLYFERA